MAEYIEREAAIAAAFSATSLGNSAFRDVYDTVNRLRLIPSAYLTPVQRERNCDRCGKPFMSYYLMICPSCDEQLTKEVLIKRGEVMPVRHGRWTQHYVGQENVPWGSDCSICGEWLVIDRTVMNEKYHYCPNCGCRMDLEVDNV